MGFTVSVAVGVCICKVVCALLPLAGCSSASVQLSSKRMCEAAGGTYAGLHRLQFA